MSDVVNLSVFTAAYGDEDAARSDYDAVKALYYELDAMDTFDAAIIEKDADGKVKVVSTHEQPTRQMGWAGAATGAAAAVTAAIFPSVALTGALVAGGAAAGAALGALMGHVTAGMSRDDLKDMGELLDEGTYGLVVVALTDVSARVEAAMTAAQKVVKKEIKADQKACEKDIKAALDS